MGGFFNSLPPELQSAFMEFYGMSGDGGQSDSYIENLGTNAAPNYNYTGGNSYASVNPNAYLGDEKEGASRLFADIIRSQTSDYLNRFAPVEDFLASSITSTGTTFLEGDMQRTRNAITGGAASARGQYQRNLSRFGIQGGALDNSMDEVSALVGGMNDTRDRDADRKIALLGGGLGAIAPKVRSSQGANG